jgi:FKBP-type peptidyl-prolyl cis-trans isomerase FkpA
MKFKLLYLFILPAFLMVSCKEDENADKKQHEDWVMEDFLLTYYPNEKPTASGLYIMNDNKGAGVTPSENDYVLMDYTTRYVETLRIFDTSWKSVALAEGISTRTTMSCEGPHKVQVKKLFQGLKEGLYAMQEGDSARLIIPSALYIGDFTPVYSDIRLYKVIPDIKQFEAQQLAQYLNTNYQKTLADSTTTGVTGLYFFPSLEGTGNLPVDNDSVYVKYNVKLLPYSDGKYLNLPARTLDKSDAFLFIIGKTSVITGFDGAIKLMKKGGKATVIIPYHRGYGEAPYTGNGQQITVPAYTTLVYELEITDIK